MHNRDGMKNSRIILKIMIIGEPETVPVCFEKGVEGL